MTSRIIYHDFQQTNNPTLQPESPSVFTARTLRKGRRWHTFWNGLGRAVDTTCLALCGAVIALSVYALTLLL